MDPHTLELLEYDKVRALLAEYAATSMGKELALAVEPSTSIQPIRAELALVTEMVDVLAAGQWPPFGGVHDVRLLVRRAAIGTMLTAEQLLQIADTLTATGAFYRFRMRLDGRFGKLIDLLMPIEDLGPIAKNITGCIDGRGHLIDAASPDLAIIRHKLAVIEEKVQSEIKRLLRDPELRKILRYPNATVNGDHYVLPVAANHRQKIAGVVHRTSSTGETIFIEPASISNLSAERTVLKADEDREVRRILRKLSAEVGKFSRQINAALDVIARVDLITSKAKYSKDYAMSAPELNTEGQLWLRSARHPILEHLFRHGAGGGSHESGVGVQESGVRSQKSEVRGQESGVGSQESGVRAERVATDVGDRKVVPIEVKLGVGFKMLVITGPNTGGKTVALKTTGLLALMAQSGMHIPATEGSAVPVFEHILADIGDEQSLEQSLSTFSSHISRIAGIFERANDKSLVLLDELGAGTDPTEGAALGRAILDQLDQVGCRAMVTTHLGDLKTYAFTNERAENGAVEFDIETLRPTYRLQIGQFGMSNALKIARRLKLPRELLKKASRYLRRRKGRMPELARLQQLREDAEKARSEALAAQHEAERRREDYEQKTSELSRQAEAAAALRDWRMKLKPGDQVWSPKFGKWAQVGRVDHRKATLFISVGIGQWEVGFDEVFPRQM
jgi:DNA mismatch repair protein MutS2